MNRREFASKAALTSSAAFMLERRFSAAMDSANFGEESGSEDIHTNGQTGSPDWTIAGLQMMVSKNIKANEAALHRAIDNAAKGGAELLLTREGSLAGYHPEFDQGELKSSLRIYRAFHESNENLWALAPGIAIVTTNAVDSINPTLCRAGVIAPDGNRVFVTPELGEQSFVHRVPIASLTTS